MSIGNLDFRADLPFGKLGEALVEQHMVSIGETVLDKPEGKHAAYDIEFAGAGNPWTAEIKWDKSHAQYGNVAIETKRRAYKGSDESDSGIAASKADVIIYLVNLDWKRHALHVATKQSLLALTTQSYKQGWYGDGGRTYNHVVPYRAFKEAAGEPLAIIEHAINQRGESI